MTRNEAQQMQTEYYNKIHIARKQANLKKTSRFIPKFSKKYSSLKNIYRLIISYAERGRDDSYSFHARISSKTLEFLHILEFRL